MILHSLILVPGTGPAFARRAQPAGCSSHAMAALSKQAYQEIPLGIGDSLGVDVDVDVDVVYVISVIGQVCVAPKFKCPLRPK
jgi:hypothetical protein